MPAQGARATRRRAVDVAVLSDQILVCACGGHDEPGYPELDARVVPHAIRHATIFGALGSVQPGHGMVLVADHEPVPLLAQLEQRNPGIFEVSYLERGPEDWRLLFRRR